MNILALNSSHDVLSVALNCGGRMSAAEKASQRNHNQFVLVMVEEILSETGLELRQLDAIAFGEGPGSFTGLRIAAAVVQGLAYGLEVPAIGVSCMAAVAQTLSHDRVAVALDAKGDKIFWGAYERGHDGSVQPVVDDCMATVAEIDLPGGGWHGAGSGWDRRPDDLLNALGDRVCGWTANAAPHAREVAVIASAMFCRGQFRDDSNIAAPRYLHPYFAGKTRT